MALTGISLEPKVAKNAVDAVSRINPKYHFPGTMKQLERQIRLSLGLPFVGRMGGQTAYGYVYNKANDTYEPIDEIFGLLWQARRYLYTSSLREVADWLNFKTDKLGYKMPISHMGLRNIMILRPPYEECLLSREEKEKLIESLCQTK
jgi:hypothetical protein